MRNYKLSYQLPSYQNKLELKPLIAFGYYGGKSRFATQIRDFLDYDTSIYAELFGGSCAVLLNKAVHNKEIYTEKSLSLCCFWRCMSDKSTANELIERLYDSEYDKKAFNDFISVVNEAEVRKMVDLSDSEVVGIAAACFVVYTASRDNAGLRFSSSKVRTHNAYQKAVDKLVEVTDRFNGVEVVHGNAIDLLNGNRFNNTDTMLYLDPVYLPEEGRGSSNNHTLYRHNFDYTEHIRLLERIREMDCKILISGYADDTRLYDRYLINGEGVEGNGAGSFRLWYRYEIEAVSAVGRGDKRRTEVIWANFV